MRWEVGLATVVAALALAGGASADEDPPGPTGLRLGLRSGFAIPAGETFDGSGALRDTITGSFPLRFDVGARLAQHFYVGGLVQMGILVPAACAGALQCSGTNARFGVMVAYHLLPTAIVDPWVGAGIGFEVLNVTRAAGSSRLELTARGFELFDLELGADLRISSGLRLGPVLSTSIARYTSIELNGTSTGDFNRAVHAWGMLGVRVAYDL